MNALEHPQIVWAEPFLSDSPAPEPALWSSELRPWSSALVEHILNTTTQPGDLVVDPFASQGTLPRVAAAQKRHLVLNHTSPAALLAVLTTAAPPHTSVLDAAFTRIADAPRRGRTLAHLVQSLYETVCPECAHTISASAFVWDRAAGEPVVKLFTCPHCQAADQVPVDLADLTLVSSLEVRGAAYWGLLSRLVAPGDPATAQARSLLDLYPPRGLLALSEILSAADQRLADPDEQRAAKAMILYALEQCISLQEPQQNRSSTFRIGQPPARFVENNVWQAFEHAYRTLRSRPAQSLPTAKDLTDLRSADGSGRVLSLSLTAPDLAEKLEPQSISLFLTEPPRFDPAAYALGFLWTGWLFGREAASRLKATLAVEQWTWDWYSRAMATALRSLLRPMAPEGALVLAFADRSSRRALALIAAAESVGWRLTRQAAQAAVLPGEIEPAWRLIFQPDSKPVVRRQGVSLSGSLQHVAQEAALAVVDQRSEPTPAVLVNSACAVRWAETGLLRSLSQHPDIARRPVSYLVDQARLALAPNMPPPGLQALTWPDQAESLPPFWEPEQLPATPPLADRVERLVVHSLEAGPRPAAEFKAAVIAAFPGLETPDAALVAACVASYAEIDGGIAHLREEDAPRRRARDLGEMLLRLYDLGHRFGFQIWVAPGEQEASAGLVPLGDGRPGTPEEWAPASVVWVQDGLPALAFAVSAHAIVHPWLAAPSDALATCPRFVVLPGGRAALLDFKLRRCPWWRDRLAWTGWGFVKFRHVRELAASPGLTQASFRARIGLDPIVTLPGQQLTLFEEPRSA